MGHGREIIICIGISSEDDGYSGEDEHGGVGSVVIRDPAKRLLI